MSIIPSSRDKLALMKQDGSFTPDVIIEMINTAIMYHCLFFGTNNSINTELGPLSLELCEIIHEQFDDDECIDVTINQDGTSVTAAVILGDELDKLSS